MDEMLKLPMPAPPVPHVSRKSPETSSGVFLRRRTDTQPAISAAV